MSDHQRLNPGHDSMRRALRLIGPLTIAAGLLFLIVGMTSFFLAFGNFGTPRYFWCAFVGIPLLGAGLAICRFAFLGSVFRYVAAETAPAAGDTFNYLAGETRPGLQTMASAIADGLSTAGRPPAAGLQCTACGQLNDADAHYCRNCGAGLSKPCPSCNHANDASAAFCDHCGTALT